jgi:hypothetical protein
MPQQVNMQRERQPRHFASTLDQTGHAHAAERLAALIDEYIRRLDALGGIAALHCLEVKAIRTKA